ncbi:MAG: tRNA (adenosine(37)-N6)-threonylcarbamoyltransferase complex transferase subunit TsaD [Candidatus Omnitrophica bacterium]|jgi:N6-L-threonylcarbamoyladenine synthase|nr:tRNA (adenosine(37)-N6)-threonylcarbamoyltransferase complex transferase subunit TsaD [Candidatus Omnitrophota bacterium]MDD5079181.1 tRNA (adenosine(37)-N6)-threonylcarbamoyltransferase complex transferase subunit TsaD [Candidatus Omnitrophota bacterium]
MNVLGIETSCDETAASVVRNGRDVRSNVVSSSLNFHKKYGGIIPEIAFRRQLETIAEVTDNALKDAGVGLNKIDLISVTDEPGLLGSLLVGISFAKALAASRDIPLLGINHLYSHIFAGYLNKGPVIRFPFVALIVSGGHTSLYYILDFDRINLLGSTRDDACGEAFDKVARILGLGYPGGPVIEQTAKKASHRSIRFNCANSADHLDFSFSGIKTAVLYYTQKHKTAGNKKVIADICASFQETTLNALVDKSVNACRIKKCATLVVGGGVAANNRLREKMADTCSRNKIKVIFPEMRFCMDNAAMVAGLGYWLFKKRGMNAGR